MPQADFFTKFGLLVKKEFLDAGQRATLQGEMTNSSSRVFAMVVDDSGKGVVNDQERSTKMVDVSAASQKALHDALVGLMPEVARHFDMTLTGIEGPHCLVYQEGDFFYTHQDVPSHPDADEEMRRRKVTVVLFVNAPSTQPAAKGYDGGALTLYNLIPGAAWEKKGFQLEAEPGLLIGFRSDVPHEVSRVARGERQTIVAWYY